nr:MAG TPA: hypothetical protein [Caudoviricetes sp.]
MSYFPFYLLLICQSLNFELFLCRYKTYNGTKINFYFLYGKFLFIFYLLNIVNIWLTY